VAEVRSGVDVRNGRGQIGRHDVSPRPASGDLSPPKQGLVWSALLLSARRRAPGRGHHPGTVRAHVSDGDTPSPVGPVD
jgi:hypothetical protein